ncbi:hypothetical protein K439DRAFT_324089 [Ramaria rubella]|nr:hypothetical protein K439DRAFT_324089 [Ramaria rubella]
MRIEKNRVISSNPFFHASSPYIPLSPIAISQTIFHYPLNLIKKQTCMKRTRDYDFTLVYCLRFVMNATRYCLRELCNRQNATPAQIYLCFHSFAEKPKDFRNRILAHCPRKSYVVLLQDLRLTHEQPVAPSRAVKSSSKQWKISWSILCLKHYIDSSAERHCWFCVYIK